MDQVSLTGQDQAYMLEALDAYGEEMNSTYDDSTDPDELADFEVTKKAIRGAKRKIQKHLLMSKLELSHTYVALEALCKIISRVIDDIESPQDLRDESHFRLLSVQATQSKIAEAFTLMGIDVRKVLQLDC